MRRLVMVFALAAAMVLSGASAALAAPHGKAETQPNDVLFFNGALEKANPNGQAGMIQGFVVHSPNCSEHTHLHD